MTQTETVKPVWVPVPENSPPTVPFVLLQAAGFSEEIPAFVWNPRALDQQLAYVIITSELNYFESIEK